MEITVVLIVAIVGMVVGLIVGWTFGKKSQPQSTEDLKPQVEALESESIRLQTDISRLEEKVRGSQEQLEAKEGELSKLKTELDQWQIKSQEWASQKTSLQENLKFEQSKQTETQKTLEGLQQKFQKEFSLIAQEMLEQNAQKLSESNQEKMKSLLAPLGQNLQQFREQIQHDRKENLQGRAELKTMIENFQKQNINISQQAQKLADALKGDVKKQGNWGEVILERLLEHSGLQKGIHYHTQTGYKNAQGQTLLPDAVIDLPEGKKVIIDSKVSLKAYERYVSAESPEDQNAALKDHVASVRAHMKGLSDKKYFAIKELEGLDFVLMFLPVEPAFSLLFQEDQPLYLEALDKNIVIVSPSTLLATLRTVHSIWSQEMQSRNALDIAQRAGALYDKFVGFIGDLTKVSDHLDKAQKSHEAAINKLSSGRGNLLGQVEKLKSLGAKTTKALPSQLVDKASSTARLEGASEPELKTDENE